MEPAAEDGHVTAVATFLELLAAAGQPGVCWAPQDLHAAFAWAETIWALAQDGQAAAKLTAAVQELQPQLPPQLQALSQRVLEAPQQLLLEQLLQQAPDASSSSSSGNSSDGSSADGSTELVEGVLAAYVSACILQQPEARRAAAEQVLLQVLAQLGQHRALGTIMQAVAAAAAHDAWRRCSLQQHGSSVGAQRQWQQRRLEALAYFTSAATLDLVAAAEVLRQKLQGGSIQLAAVLSDLPTRLELEVSALALLLPGWEALLRRLSAQQGKGFKNGAGIGAASSTAGRPQQWQEEVEHVLCSTCREQPQLVLQLPPALLAEACRQSFRLLRGLAAMLDEQRMEQQPKPRQEEQPGAVALDPPSLPETLEMLCEHVLQYDDFAAAYMRLHCACCKSVNSIG